MKLEKWRETYYMHSGKSSDIARQLGLAGIALIWIFKEDKAGIGWIVPSQLIPVAFLILIGLALDFMHYVIATAIWGIYSWCKERSGASEDDEVFTPRWMNWPAIFFFITKTISIFLAYTLLLRYLYHRFV